ncbi:hypothetical protein J3E71DRAFT_245740 [Bipolaris maydis]|nr:hypothetical protein J3E71DRAFT_245740 [Bipolaris maydis]
MALAMEGLFASCTPTIAWNYHFGDMEAFYTKRFAYCNLFNAYEVMVSAGDKSQRGDKSQKRGDKSQQPLQDKRLKRAEEAAAKEAKAKAKGKRGRKSKNAAQETAEATCQISGRIRVRTRAPGFCDLNQSGLIAKVHP